MSRSTVLQQRTVVAAAEFLHCDFPACTAEVEFSKDDSFPRGWWTCEAYDGETREPETRHLCPGCGADALGKKR